MLDALPAALEGSFGACAAFFNTCNRTRTLVVGFLQAAYMAHLSLRLQGLLDIAQHNRLHGVLRWQSHARKMPLASVSPTLLLEMGCLLDASVSCCQHCVLAQGYLSYNTRGRAVPIHSAFLLHHGLKTPAASTVDASTAMWRLCAAVSALANGCLCMPPITRPIIMALATSRVSKVLSAEEPRLELPPAAVATQPARHDECARDNKAFAY
jgi:hypothetical protein